MKNFYATITLLLFFCQMQALQAATLVGWAEMPLHIYAEGPTEGRFNFGADVSSNKQVVQGFSAVLQSDAEDNFYFSSDNGFGEKNNSADALIRLYEVQIDFKTANQKNDAVKPLRYINVKDPDRKLSFKIQADFSHYYNAVGNPLVDKGIVENRWLTGADIDPESVRIDKNGNVWLGDEFGPFLIKADAAGKVLRSEIPLPDVTSPDNPNADNLKPNLPSTGGFEGMAITSSGDMLYPMLEATVEGDAQKTLRIYQFDVNAERYTGVVYRYQLDEQGTNIGDFVAVNEHEFLVLERNAATKLADKPFKKIYLVDINQLNDKQFVQKRELVDLMQLQDPNDLNKDGHNTYAFAYSHIENLLILDKSTLLVANDNNYAGRTYFIKIKLDSDLNMASFNQPNINKNDWVNSKAQPFGFNLGDHSFFGWATVLLYFVAAFRTGYKAKLTIKNKESCYFWLGLTAFLVFLGLNKQLDLQSNLTEWLRRSAKAHGWYEQRRGYQLLFISIMGLAIPILLISLRLFLYHSWQRYKLTWVGIVLLLIFVVIRAASFHHVDIVFYQTIGSIRYYQLLEMLAIGIIIVGTFFENKKIPPTAKPLNAANPIVHIEAEGDLVSCPKCGQKPLSETRHGRVFKCKSCKHIYEIRLLDDSTLQPN
ncbi:MAG: esterase-like activity of phytase family protein [Pseudomonadota bacterium]